jgi:hypothetical protein
MRGGPLMVGVQLPHFLAALPPASLDEVFIVYDVGAASPALRGITPTPKEIRSTSRAY